MKKGQTYGNGSITKDEKNNRWVGRYELGKDANGKRKRKVVYGKTKEEVKQKLKQIQLNIYTGNFVDDSEVTIYHLGRQMIDEKYNLGKIAQVTYLRTNESFKRLAPIYHTPLQKCTITQVKSFLQSETAYAQSTLDKSFELLKRIFAEAFKRGIISKNIMLEIEKPRSKKKSEKVRGLTIDERKKLIKILTENDIQYSAQMLISLYTGMRMGEVNALKVSDVNFNFRQINIRRTVTTDEHGKAIFGDTAKTNAGRRIIPLNYNIEGILRVAIGNRKSGYVFTRADGSAISTNSVLCQYTRVKEKYDFVDPNTEGRVDLHSLRHTYATMSIEAGVQAKVLQKLLGHTDISVTLNTYADVFEAYQDKEVEKLNEYWQKTGLAIAENASDKSNEKIVKIG